MSGGSSSTDPYYGKDPPKKKKKQRLDPSELPTKPLGPVKVIPMPKFGRRPMTGKGYSRVNWYRCDHCGKIYLSRYPAGGVHGTCGPKCQSDWQKEYHKGRKLSEEHKRKIGEAKLGVPRSEDTKNKVSASRKKRFEDPEFRAAQKQIRRTPEFRKKSSESKLGPKNPNWKGGPDANKRVPTPADIYRGSADWKRKAEEIRDRDNNSCQSCGKKGQDGENLDVHHTYPLNKWIDDGKDPNDYPDDWLITLDKSCHSKADAQDGDFKLPPEKE